MKVLILSMHKDKEYLGQAIFNGAEGYLLKEDVDKELLAAIEMIRAGESLCSLAFPCKRLQGILP